MAQEFLILNIIIWIGLYLIVGLSLNIEYGFGGIPNFGRALAVLIGAIAVGGVVNRILMVILGVSGQIIDASGVVKTAFNDIIAQNPAVGIAILVFSLILAGFLGAVTGAIFILPSAKLSEDYLAITLLALSESAFLISYYHPDIIGGYYGVTFPNVLNFIPGEQRLFAFAFIIILIAILVYILVSRMLASPYGRLLKAMRENEAVVETYGKDIMMLRIKTVAVGSGIAALAGALYSMFSVNVIATNFSRVEWTFYPILMILLGGLGNTRGVFIGVASFVIARIFLITYKFEIVSTLGLPFDPVWLEYILFGFVMLVILVYRPEGILKEKPILTEPIKKVVKKRNIKSKLDI
ncbi:amino acid/amide ABC transporter membrane protein 2, HAAT family [Archaeoglobus sulfaticallidus PM70-1]|uniref:Amino acid/amide ABC transporter membrane protein 2, HAAT family n=1 Tax=Archaeoglobus sulfaticallidus PM70-1 TaxID=387631 RepID=N0BDP3_9EURY|nr:branched-chain amino acid ABC transporter permease [Archaeoglobus sulfaticallidus]AGK61754.1 amino acid/amide ABC transporter membrane protein 2, HAAT family [Archaeoglobus sulfaticallidus PM70-1]